MFFELEWFWLKWIHLADYFIQRDGQYGGDLNLQLFGFEIKQTPSKLNLSLITCGFTSADI